MTVQMGIQSCSPPAKVIVVLSLHLLRECFETSSRVSSYFIYYIDPCIDLSINLTLVFPFTQSMCGWVLLSTQLNFQMSLLGQWLTDAVQKEVMNKECGPCICYCSWAAHKCFLWLWFFAKLISLKTFMIIPAIFSAQIHSILSSGWCCRIVAGRQILLNRMDQVIKNSNYYGMISLMRRKDTGSTDLLCASWSKHNSQVVQKQG